VPIFSTAPAAIKNDAQFKSGQNQLENKQLALLISIRATLCSSTCVSNDRFDDNYVLFPLSNTSGNSWPAVGCY